MSTALGWALVGGVAAMLTALVPALHIYNVAALFLLWVTERGIPIETETLAFLFLGMVTGYTMLSVVPGVFFAVPDESMAFTILPAQRYLLEGRGYEAVTLMGLGGLGGLGLVAFLAPLAPHVLPAARTILQPHLPWLLWAVVTYLLLSEWPKGSERPPAGWRRWWDGWRSLLAGLGTFLLSGLLGLILRVRSPLPVTVAYQGLMPAFVGLFAVPWLLMNLSARVTLPPQRIGEAVDAPPLLVLQATLAGVAGGSFAAFFPSVTGGIGGFLAGHATGQRDARAFLVAQGATRVVYYVGGYLLFFVPGLQLTRGGMAWMLSTQGTLYGPQILLWAAASALCVGALTFLLSLGLARLAARLIAAVGYRRINALSLAVVLGLVYALTGWPGLAVCTVATGIGLLPTLWGARRLNALGLLLLGLALGLAGLEAPVLRMLGLLG